MCITFLKTQPNPQSELPYRLILLFNREESMSRPTKQLDFWEEDPNIIGGRDMKASGTWLGVNLKTGNIAILTNLRKGKFYLWKVRNETFVSRGKVTHEFLKSSFYENLDIDIEESSYALMNAKIIEYMRTSFKQKLRPFNLILGNLKTMKFFYKNTEFQSEKVELLESGFHVMTNCQKSVDWKKGLFGIDELKKLCQKTEKTQPEKQDFITSGMKILRNSTNFSFLGLGQHSIFNYKNSVNGGVWGTRSSTVILLDQKGNLSMCEQFYDLQNQDQFKCTSKIGKIDL